MTDAILYIALSGCQWRMLPKVFSPVSTVQGYFYAWRDSGLWQSVNHLLVMSARELEGREEPRRPFSQCPSRQLSASVQTSLRAGNAG